MKNKTNTMSSAVDDLNKAFATLVTPVLSRVNQSIIDFNNACEKVKKLKKNKN
jgi:hypothetical protein